jgi:hypothetical protein
VYLKYYIFTGILSNLKIKDKLKDQKEKIFQLHNILYRFENLRSLITYILVIVLKLSDVEFFL